MFVKYKVSTLKSHLSAEITVCTCKHCKSVNSSLETVKLKIILVHYFQYQS